MKVESKAAIKDIVANMDADVYVVKGDVDEIVNWMKADGWTGFTKEEVEVVVKELQTDPYFVKLAERIA